MAGQARRRPSPRASGVTAPGLFGVAGGVPLGTQERCCRRNVIMSGLGKMKMSGLLLGTRGLCITHTLWAGAVVCLLLLARISLANA